MAMYYTKQQFLYIMSIWDILKRETVLVNWVSVLLLLKAGFFVIDLWCRNMDQWMAPQRGVLLPYGPVSWAGILC